ncbi:MAG TPA: FliM/FliN family flagellar motor switch protein [Terriglobia bacterium]|nr:FliM/FliN family flagellar motor switch protein [Terriglobia bacterium]
MNTTEISQLSAQGRDYLAVWSHAVSEGLGRLAGSAVAVEALASGESPQQAGAPEAGVWMRFFAGKAGEQAFFLSAEDALRLVQLLLGGEPKASAVLTEEDREAVAQFFQQIATMVPVSDWLGAAGELDFAGLEAPAWENAGQLDFRFSNLQGALLTLHAQLSGDFLTALQAAKTVSNKEETKPLPPPPRPASSPGAVRDVHLELLMDVELEVSLRFGRREMLLKDVLNLTSGSVVELDQQVQDPVELLVGSKVIAWGEVVAVDGNYGLRITGLASREERLQSLKK